MHTDTSIENFETDAEMLEFFLGPGYFVLHRIKDKITLSPEQKGELQDLIEDRNHFGIWALVSNLRKGR